MKRKEDYKNSSKNGTHRGNIYLKKLGELENKSTKLLNNSYVFFCY